MKNQSHKIQSQSDIYMITEDGDIPETICLVWGNDPEPALVEYRAKKKAYMESYRAWDQDFRDNFGPGLAPKGKNALAYKKWGREWLKFSPKLAAHMQKFRESNKLESVTEFLKKRGYSIMKSNYRFV